MNNILHIGFSCNKITNFFLLDSICAVFLTHWVSQCTSGSGGRFLLQVVSLKRTAVGILSPEKHEKGRKTR